MSLFTTNDGAQIHYEDEGSGRPLVLIHGWSQSSQVFRKNVPELARQCRVISVDVRGHGQSSKVDHGYRISRFAQDVHQLISHLGLADVTLLGWSMGCSIIWSYWDLFVDENLSKLILMDQPGLLLIRDDNPLGMWTQDEITSAAAAIIDDQLAFTNDLVRGSTYGVSEDEIQFLIAENLLMPAQYSARLMLHHWTTDWRDVIPTITLPTLIMGGARSFVNPDSQIWNHEHIRGSRLETFDGSGHFLFFEQPDRFNKLVAEFLAE